MLNMHAPFAYLLDSPSYTQFSYMLSRSKVRLSTTLCNYFYDENCRFLIADITKSSSFIRHVALCTSTVFQNLEMQLWFRNCEQFDT